MSILNSKHGCPGWIHVNEFGLAVSQQVDRNQSLHRRMFF